MPSKLKDLAARRLCTPPSFLPEAIQMEVYMGSSAYGCSSNTSDLDVYGFYIQDKEVIFPHLQGHIDNFDESPNYFENYTEHHIKDLSAQGGKGVEYDYSLQGICKYFKLVMQNNPNMVDSLFVPLRCIMFITPIGQMVRDNRHMFLHKGCYHKFRGYSFQQLHKMRIKNPSADSKRKEAFDKYGFDPKFAYHIVRLLNECEQILVEGDLDLERSKEQLKSIRRGEWTIDQIENYFRDNEARLQTLYDNSKLPYDPPVDKIKQLLLNCLEQHFGSLDKVITTVDPARKVISEIEDILYFYRNSKGE